jgi:hypothetical protein
MPSVAKSLGHFVRILERHGKHFPKGESARQVAEKILHNKNSLVTDLAPHTFGKRFAKTVDKYHSKVQSRLADADIKAGYKVHKLLKNNKGKLRDKLSNAFVYNHSVPLKESVKGEPDKAIHVGVPMLTAPLEKLRKGALPLIGSFAVGSKLSEMQADKGGGHGMKKEQAQRSDLIEKLSSMMGAIDPSIDITESASQTQMTANLASIASKMLKFAANENRRLTSENEKLASEVQVLRSEMHKKTKLESATKLASTMNEKGMLKKADINAQVEKIMELDEAGFEMLKTAIENINGTGLDKDGVDNLTFLGTGINIDIKDKKATLEDSISEEVCK